MMYTFMVVILLAAISGVHQSLRKVSKRTSDFFLRNAEFVCDLTHFPESVRQNKNSTQAFDACHY